MYLTLIPCLKTKKTGVLSQPSTVHTFSKINSDRTTSGPFPKTWRLTESDWKERNKWVFKRIKMQELNWDLEWGWGKGGGWKTLKCKENCSWEHCGCKTGGERPFGILNRRMAISFDSSQIATLGVRTAFSPYLFSFQASANDLASWHIAEFCINMCTFKSLRKLNINPFRKNVFKEPSINSKKPLLLLLSPKSYIVFHRILPFVYISPQFLFWGVLFCSSGSWSDFECLQHDVN